MSFSPGAELRQERIASGLLRMHNPPAPGGAPLLLHRSRSPLPPLPILRAERIVADRHLPLIPPPDLVTPRSRRGISPLDETNSGVQTVAFFLFFYCVLLAGKRVSEFETDRAPLNLIGLT